MKKSVIFRGSVLYAGAASRDIPKNYLKESVIKLREWFDGEVIVSTWKGQEEHLKGIDGIDKVVLTDDPGPGPVQHIKRQTLSYINGIKESTGDLLMVTRTDISHEVDPFPYLFELKQNDGAFRVFDERIITGNMMTIYPDGPEYPSHFRICDWFQIGKREDIFKWGDIFGLINNDIIIGNPCTEQIWSLSVLKKYYDDSIDYHNIEPIKKYAWDYLLNNFRILDMKSTLKALNHNWNFQPEYLPCYITEKMYNDVYISKYKELK
jgi:hypothetical protein